MPLRVKREKLRAYPPNCSVSLLSNLFKSLSFLRTSSIFSTGVQHGRVMLSAKLPPDFGQ